MPTLQETQVARLTREQLLDDAYCQFAEAVFHVPASQHAAYCRWMFAENPHGEGGDALPIYIFLEDARPVAQVGFIPVRIQTPGGVLRGGWCVDFFALPSHQRRGIGHVLLDVAEPDHDVLLALGSTVASRSLLIKRRWHAAGPTTKHKHALRPWGVLASRFVPHPRQAAPAATGSDRIPERALAAALQRAERALRLRVTRVESPEALAAAMIRPPPSPSPQIDKDAEWLSWRYLSNPLMSYVALRVDDGDHPALAFLRFSSHAGRRAVHLVDLLVACDADMRRRRRLLAAIAHVACSLGADALSCQTSDPQTLAALPRGLFTTRSEGAILFHTTPPRGEWGASGDWRLYAGDCDIDALLARDATC